MRFNSALCLAVLVAGCGVGTRYTDGGINQDGGGHGFDFAGGMVCSPMDPPACDGNAVKVCRSDGGGYDFLPCSGACVAVTGVAACACTLGDLRCVGSSVEKCGMDGAFHLDHACAPGLNCQGGVCGDARCDDEVMSTNPHALPTNAWPRFRHDNRNTGVTPTALADNPVMKWRIPVGGTNYGTNAGTLASGPVVNQNNQIFIGAGEQDMMMGSYYSFDKMGNKLFTFPANRGFGLSTPAVRQDGTSYFSTSTAHLFAVDPKGAQAWMFQVGSVADADPIITRDGNVIYASDDGSVYALDFAGKPLWMSDKLTGPGEVDSGLAESCDGRILAGGRGGWYALDAATGKTLWKVPCTDPYGESSPMVSADGTMYGFDSAGVGVAIDKTGMVLWNKTFGPPTNGGFATAKVANTLFTVLGDGQLHAVDAANGNELWKRPVGAAVSEENAGPIADGKQRIYYNSTDGNVYAFDMNGNPVWKIPSSGKTVPGQWAGTMAIGNDGTLYVPGNDGFLYAFQ